MPAFASVACLPHGSSTEAGCTSTWLSIRAFAKTGWRAKNEPGRCPAGQVEW
jgi:hypothetical protein